MGLFRRNKLSNPETKDNPCEGKLHILAVNINKNWVICILAALVIILSAVIFASNLFETKNVAIIISFTATILSIVLSLLAILYSYFGNIDSSENLSEIRSAVSEIRATENAIKDFVSSINLGMNAFNSSFQNISNQVGNGNSTGPATQNNVSNTSTVDNNAPSPEPENDQS